MINFIYRCIPILTLLFLLISCSSPPEPDVGESPVAQEGDYQSGQVFQEGDYQSGQVFIGTRNQQNNIQPYRSGESLALLLTTDLRNNLDHNFGSNKAPKFSLVDPGIDNESPVLLTEDRLDFIIESALRAVEEANLTNSTDMNLVISAVIKGAESSLSELDFGSGIFTTNVVGGIVASLEHSVRSHSEYLAVAPGEDTTQKLMELLGNIAQTAISHLGEAGLSGEECKWGSSIIVDIQIGSFDEFDGINEEQVEEAISSVVGGAIKGIGESTVNGCAVDPASMASAITSGAINALDNIEVENFDSNDLGDMISVITSSATGALDEIKIEGFGSNDIGGMVHAITAGATGSLDNIEMERFDLSDIGNMVHAITAGATSALDEIEIEGFESEDLGDVVSEITAGATSALDEIVIEGFGSEYLVIVVRDITAGAASALDEIVMERFDVDDLILMVNKITAGATGALDEIEVEDYNADDLGGMLNAIAAGTTSSLDKINMEGFDVTDLDDMTNAITAGATGALDEIEMVDFDTEDLGDVIEEITAGTTDAVDGLQMEGIDCNLIGDILSAISSGATSSLDDIAMDGLGASDLVNIVGKITSGATSAVDKLKIKWFDCKIAAMLSSITAGATGVLEELEMPEEEDAPIEVDLGDIITAATEGTTSTLDELEIDGFDPDDESIVEEISIQIDDAVAESVSTIVEITDPSINIADGSDFTNDSSLDINFAADGYVTQMYVTHEPGCDSGGEWSYFKSVLSDWSLSPDQLNNTATVYVRFKNGTGFETDCISDTIVHDNIPPSIMDLSDDTIVATSKTWPLECDDICSYRYVIDNYPDTEPTGDFQNINEVLHNEGTGTYYLHLQAMDMAGNVGNVQHASAVLDNTRPSLIYVLRESGSTDSTRGPNAQFIITFDEDVYNVSVDDFSLVLTGTVTASIDSVTPSSPFEYEVSIGSIAGQGSMQLDISNLANDVVDQVGHSLIIDDIKNEEGFTILINTRVTDCTGLPANALCNSVDNIVQTWDGIAWQPPADEVYNIEASDTECRYQCNVNYTWDGISNCEADSKVVDCDGLPANALWNSVSSITQTWDGASWQPSAEEKYIFEASNTECRFKCKYNYTWDGNSICEADSKVVDCSGLPSNALWNSVSSIAQTWDGTSWQPSAEEKYSVEASDTECRFKCKDNYTWDGNSICEADSKVVDCAGLPANALWNSVSSITQTWDGASWQPSATEVYNTEVSDTECRFKCMDNYTWDGTICEADSRVVDCSGLPSNALWNSVGSITQTWDGNSWQPSETAGVYNTDASDTE